MIDARLAGSLFQYLDRTDDRDLSGVTRVRRRRDYSDAHTSLLPYLLEPYENGYWSLSGKWNYASPLTLYLAEELQPLTELGETTTKNTTPVPVLARRLSDEARALAIRISGRVSSINRLFLAALKDDQGVEHRIPAADEWIGKINLSTIRSTFKEAYEIFKSEIFYDGFNGGVGLDLFALPSGLLVFVGTPRLSEGHLEIAAGKREPIETFSRFFSALCLLDQPKFGRIFAPDEILFKPYFALVSAVYPTILRDEQTSARFTQALDYYTAEDYKHCVTALGLIAEDYLTRIHNTLLRRQCDDGLTLGQIFDSLNRSVAALLQPQQPGQKQLDPIYTEVSAFSGSAEDTKAIFRELLNTIKEDRALFSKKLDELTKQPQRGPVFPQRIRESVTEILRMRNAASHNTRIAVGRYEADRTLYCVISVVTWWQSKLDSVDWTKTKIDVLRDLMTEAK